jgi:hypothetical protein
MLLGGDGVGTQGEARSDTLTGSRTEADGGSRSAGARTPATSQIGRFARWSVAGIRLSRVTDCLRAAGNSSDRASGDLGQRAKARSSRVLEGCSMSDLARDSQ